MVVCGTPWQPVMPPRRGADRTEFYAYILLPGFSLSFHAATLGRSRSSLNVYRSAAMKAAKADPAVMEAIEAAVSRIRPEDGLRMAQLRKGAQLPSWSRLAIYDYRRRGFSRREIAAAFQCSPGTVANILQGKGTAYALFSGERRLTPSQLRPSGRWHAGKSRTSGIFCSNSKQKQQSNRIPPD